MLDPRRLLTFRAVAQAGSFSAAARELVADPARGLPAGGRARARAGGAAAAPRRRRAHPDRRRDGRARARARRWPTRLALADAQLAELGDDRGALRVGGFPSALATLVPAAIASVVPQRVEAVEGTVERARRGRGRRQPACRRPLPGRGRAARASMPACAATSCSTSRSSSPSGPSTASRGGAPSRLRELADDPWVAPSERGIVRNACVAAGLRARHRLRRARRARDPRARGRRAGRHAHAAPHRRAPARRPRRSSCATSRRAARSTR